MGIAESKLSRLTSGQARVCKAIVDCPTLEVIPLLLGFQLERKNCGFLLVGPDWRTREALTYIRGVGLYWDWQTRQAFTDDLEYRESPQWDCLLDCLIELAKEFYHENA